MENPTETETTDENSEEYDRGKTNGIFYKTQLCFRFMQGKCRYDSCKFAHGIEELRNPQRLAGDHDQEFYRSRNNGSIRRPRTEDFDNKEAVNDTGSFPQRLVQGLKRRRVCYQWEATGTCSFGEKCRYPHEPLKHAEEDHEGFKNGHEGFKNGGSFNCKMSPKLKTLNVTAVAYPGHVTGNKIVIDASHIIEKTVNVTSIQKSMEVDKNTNNNALIQVSACERSLSRWKGPQKISRIYGDWIDE